MADFKYGKYNGQRLFLEQSDTNTEWNFDPTKAYLEIGIKGTKQDGLVEKRMKVIKQKIAKDLATGFDPGQQQSPQRNPSTNQAEIQNIFKIEYDKIIKENTEQRAEYEKKIATKNTQINQLNTNLENLKTENGFTNDNIRKEKEKAETYAD